MKTTMEHDLSSVMSALMGSVTQQNPGVQLPQRPLAQKQSLEVVFSGRLNHRVIKKSSAGIVLSAQLSETSYSQNGVENDEPLLFESPFLIKLTPQGLIKNVSFLPEVPETNKHLIKSLVEQTQLSLSGEFNIDWRSREVIADTSYVTSYHREQDDFNKNVVRLTKRYSSPTLLKSNELAKLIPTIDEMTTTAEVAIDGSGLRSLSHTGALRYTHKGKLTASGRSILTMDKMDEVNITLLDSEEALMSSEARKVLKRISGYKIPRALLKQVAPLSVSQVVEGYVKVFSEDRYKGMLIIKAYLVRYPERSEELLTELLKFLERGKYSRIAGGLHAYVSIAHDQAIDALIKYLSIPNEDVQGLITSSLMLLKKPSVMLVEKLWEIRNQDYLKGSFLKHVMTNIFGALGSAKNESPKITQMVFDHLKSDIENPSSPDNLQMSLSAIANIKDPALVMPIVEPYFNDAKVAKRQLAFDAYKYLEGDDAFDRFAYFFSKESDERVLIRAADTARQMPTSDSRNTWAGEQLLQSNIAKVQKSAVEILGHELKEYPENENTLRAALSLVRDRTVRRAIYVYIKPVKAKGGK